MPPKSRNGKSSRSRSRSSNNESTSSNNESTTAFVTNTPVAREKVGEKHAREDVDDLLTSRKRLQTQVDSQKDYLRCVITQEIMCDPVIAQDGNTYERYELLRWLETHSTSPLDPSCRLDADGLVVNRAVKQQIEDLFASGALDDEEQLAWNERKALISTRSQESEECRTQAKSALADLRELEMLNFSPPSGSMAPDLHGYMQRQEDINDRMRAILIDWIVSVHSAFELHPKTLHLAVSILDNYCACNQVKRSKYQCVGTVALLIASKCIDNNVPSYKRLEFVTSGAAPVDDIIKMEVCIAKTFRCHIKASQPTYSAKQIEKLTARPTSYLFCRKLLLVAGVDSNVGEDGFPYAEHDVSSSKAGNRALYFLDRCLQEYDMLAVKPSLIAAAAVYLTLSIDKRYLPWTMQLKRASGGLTEKDLIPVAERIVKHTNSRPTTSVLQRQLDAVQKKYEGRRFQRVGATRYDMCKTMILKAI